MVFFGKILIPLSDTKVNHYQDIQGIMDSRTKWFFFNTSLTIAIEFWGFYLLTNRRKWKPRCQNGGNGEIAEPKQFFCLYPQNDISTCLIKTIKECKSTIQNWWTKLSPLWATWSPIRSEIGVDSWTGWGNGHYFDCILKVFCHFFMV